jgi:hypothetical protein
MWEVLNGETQPVPLEEAGRWLPAVLEVHTRGGTLVVVDYTLWKAKIKVQQRKKEESNDDKDTG